MKTGLQAGRRVAGRDAPAAYSGDGGFTLIELLLALGLFTVCIAMVACLFPAAIFQAKAADEHTLAAIIEQNAFATIRARVTYARLNNMDPNAQRGVAVDPNAFVPLVIDPVDDPNVRGVDLQPQDALYLSQNASSVTNSGWVALVRQVAPNRNDYEVVIVPYAINKLDGGGSGRVDFALNGNPTNHPAARHEANVSVTVGPDGIATANIDPRFIAVGSPVIFANGRYAFIVGQDPTTGRAVLSANFGATATPVDVYVYGGGGGGRKSPAIGCLVVRTSLKPV